MGNRVAAERMSPRDRYLLAAFNRNVADLPGHVPGLNVLGEGTMEENTVLHTAASQGRGFMIQEVLERYKQDENVLQLFFSRNTAGDTPLHCAARAGHDNCVQAMIGGLQDITSLITATNNAGDNALHSAARHGHHQVVQTLMAIEPQLSHVLNNAGTSALYLAVMSGSLASVHAILLGNEDANPFEVATKGPNSQNALHAAVLQSYEMTDKVLTSRPDLAKDTDTSINGTPLHFAVADGNFTIVKRILSTDQVNANVILAVRDKDGRSALHAAARNGHTEVVRLLIDRCPDASEIRDNKGKTFLHAASEGDNTACIHRIVSYVLETPMLEDLLNAQDDQGNTPLHLLVLNRKGSYAVQKLLLSGKLQINIMNNDGHTAFDRVKSATSFFSMVSSVVLLSIHGARFGPDRQDKVIEWKNVDLTRWRKDTCKNLALVSTLIATVAFASLLNVPGGYGDDGKANLDGNRVYDAFIVLDSIAVFTSVMATLLLVYGTATSLGSWMTFAISLHCLWVSVLSLTLACFGAIGAVSKKRSSISLQLIITVIGLLTQLLSVFALPVSLINLLRFLLPGRTSRQRIVDNHATRNFPLAGPFAFNVLVFMAINVLALVALTTSVVWGVSP